MKLFSAGVLCEEFSRGSNNGFGGLGRLRSEPFVLGFRYTACVVNAKQAEAPS